MLLLLFLGGGGTAEAAVTGGSADYPKKKRYVQRVGDRLMVFSDPAMALAFASAESGKGKESPVADKATETVPVATETVPIQAIEQIAKVYKREKQVAQARKREDWETMLKVYEALMRQQDEEDVEILLLLAL